MPGTVLGAGNIAEDTAVEAMPLFSILTGRDKQDTQFFNLNMTGPWDQIIPCGGGSPGIGGCWAASLASTH